MTTMMTYHKYFIILFLWKAELKDLAAESSDSESWSQEDEAVNFGDDDEDEESDSDDYTCKSSIMSSDSEISEKDKWFCTQCNVKTNNPYLRYCLRCFRVSFKCVLSIPISDSKTLLV